MTWKELKDRFEAEGVKDDDHINCIDVGDLHDFVVGITETDDGRELRVY